MVKKALKRELPVRILSAPTAKELEPTPRERRLYKELDDWMKRSAGRDYLIGVPDYRP